MDDVKRSDQSDNLFIRDFFVIFAENKGIN